MVMRTRSGFGYKIDYDRAIANDERMVARLTDPTLIAASATMTEAEWAIYETRHMDVVWWASMDPARTDERLAILGLTRDDARDMCLAIYNDGWDDPLFAASLGRIDPSAGNYRNGMDLAERFKDFYNDLDRPAKRAECLRAAKTSLARHRRNKAKYEQEQA